MYRKYIEEMVTVEHVSVVNSFGSLITTRLS